MERERRQQIAEQTLFRCMSTILSKMHDIDHIPQAYEFEVSGDFAVFTKHVESHLDSTQIRVGGAKPEKPEPMIQKVLQNPPGFTST